MARKIEGMKKRSSSPSPSPSPQPKPTPGLAKQKGTVLPKSPKLSRQAGPVLPKGGASTPAPGGGYPGGGLPGGNPGTFSLMSGMGDPSGGIGVTAPSDEDYLAGDSGYQTQLSALQGALQRFLADSDFQRNTYNTDYGKSLRELGYDEGTKAWNWNDKLTASGRGYQNQLDDFAGRNMLQSSAYADAFGELQRMLGQQYDSMSTAKGTFMTDLDNQIANYRAESTANQQAARAEALARRAAQYGL